MPVVAQFLEWERERHQASAGEGLDFSRAYWRGPVCARRALDLERRQIEQLDLGPIVSLTDHDNIDASLVLKRDGRTLNRVTVDGSTEDLPGLTGKIAAAIRQGIKKP